MTQTPATALHAFRRGKAARAWPALLVAALLVPVWISPFFPSQDGPSHVANAWILGQLLRGDGGPYAAVYQVNPRPVPNWFSHAALAALMTLARPEVAERLLLTGYVLLLVWGFRRALVALRPGAAPLFAVVTPFVQGSWLYLGYYNRLLGAVAFLLALGFGLRHGRRPGALATLGLGLLLLWTYSCSAMSAVLAVVALSLLLLGATLQDTIEARSDRWRALARRAGALALAAAPALALVLHFQARQWPGAVPTRPGPSLAVRLWEVLTLQQLVALHPWEPALAAGLAAVLAVAALIALWARLQRRGFETADALLAFTLAAAAIGLVAPVVPIEGQGWYGAPIDDKIAPHLPLTFLLWLAAAPWGRRARSLLLVSTVAVGLALLAVRLPCQLRIEQQLREYVSVAPFLPPGSALLPVGYAHEGRSEDGRALSVGSWPFRHAASRLVPWRGVLDLDNYAAQTNFFPVIDREGYDPFDLLGTSFDHTPACVRLGRFNRLSPRPADFVLTWALSETDLGDACTRDLLRQLETRYRRVHVSQPRGLAALYQRLPP
ncbi:MAG TPA: hypothetical protein VMX54_10425 [Vicinamibacteria bacterium]|nr:hypothetical protein [Vicinamibacteria bacterium]